MDGELLSTIKGMIRMSLYNLKKKKFDDGYRYVDLNGNGFTMDQICELTRFVHIDKDDLSI